jgi:hypothetical protein
MTTQLQTRWEGKDCAVDNDGVKYFRCVGSQLLLFDVFHRACERRSQSTITRVAEEEGGTENVSRFSFFERKPQCCKEYLKVR